jgi:multidrug efflux pump subunit AcrA (membrane-fusion protein)
MKKKKYLLTVGIACVVLAASIAVAVFALAGENPAVANFTVLHRGDLANSISAKGVVESRAKRNVYSSAGAMVKAVYVKVGDRVSEGDELCKLDADDIELSLAQQRAELAAAQQSGFIQIQSSGRAYDEASANLENGDNAQIVSAASNLKSASTALENATKAYNDALADFTSGDIAQIAAAQSGVYSAELDLAAKTANYDSAKALYEAGGISKSEMEQSEAAYAQSEIKHMDALRLLDDAKAAARKTLEQAKISLNTAKTTYGNAKASVSAAETAARQDLDRLAGNVESARIAADDEARAIAVRKLEKQIRDASIQAPTSGTVTAAYAREGAAASGLLFVIEDTSRLAIATKFREYDIGRVFPGLSVAIKTNYTGSSEYAGVVAKIDPTAVKNANGDTLSSSDVEFAAEVAVTSENSDLKIGTNANLSVVTEKKENVYYVPYDAVVATENGETVVYSASRQADGYTAHAIAVSTGMETDFYVEIAGDELADGMMILKDASAMQNGMAIQLGQGEQL